MSIACSIWVTFSVLQASKVCCTTDCSAQRLRPKARCNAWSLRRRVLISTSPWAPARIALNPSYNFSLGVSLTVFWAICTRWRMGPNRSSCCSFTPTAARLAQAVKWLVVFVVDSFMGMGLLSSVSTSLIGMHHHLPFRKSLSLGSSLPLVWTKFR